MKTYQTLLKEITTSHEGIESTLPHHSSRLYGFLRAGNPPLQSTDPNGDHNSLAKEDGYTGKAHAIDSGLVRFHHTGPNKSEGGYEFVDSPEARKTVSDHIRKSRHLASVALDIHGPSGFSSNFFEDPRAAVRHLS